MKKDIIHHCSATPEDQRLTPDQLSDQHAARGIRRPGGYHIYVDKFGVAHKLRDFNQQGAHAYGYNKTTIGICYEGGIIAGGNPNNPAHAKDTRTPEQTDALNKATIEALKWNFDQGHFDVEIMGHRDLSPDIDGDGIIEPWEWLKQCPCYDARGFYKDLPSFVKQFYLNDRAEKQES